MHKKLSTFTREHPFKRSFISQNLADQVSESDLNHPMVTSSSILNHKKGKDGNVAVSLKKLKTMSLMPQQEL